nr:class I SAM-dependent methyltransferase [Corynebacterium mustelae]
MELESTNFSAAETARAQQTHWNADALDYHDRHKNYLSGFYWCPEMLNEEHARLLGDVANQRILEIGCGSAPCARWLAHQFATADIFAFDISVNMLRAAPDVEKRNQPTNLHLIQADATLLPFADTSFDQVFSVFGAIPFIANLASLFTAVARCLRPGGRFIYATNHPMRWVFLDDPGEAGLLAAVSYFEDNYHEMDSESGELTYIEYHHSFGDHVRALTAAGFQLVDVLEPKWPDDLTEIWGQWSPLRGKIFPGTAIFLAELLPNRR